MNAKGRESLDRLAAELKELSKDPDLIRNRYDRFRRLGVTK